MDEQPLYESRRMFRNLWQRYRIYSDRVELKLFGKGKIIRADDLVEVEVRRPPVRGKGFAYSFALKMDLADFYCHVAIHRRSGWIKHVRVTPDDPEEFVRVCKTIMMNRGQ